jgi:hypothetical protein
MKIGEAIKLLTDLKKKHGDHEVYIHVQTDHWVKPVYSDKNIMIMMEKGKEKEK